MDSRRTGPHLVEMDTEDGVRARLAAGGLNGGWPVLVVVGGAAGLSGSAEAVVRRVIEQLVVPVAVERNAAIVDGGTDSGIMRMIGQAHADLAAKPPLVGVAVRRLVRVAGQDETDVAEDAADAEPHHTHLVLVPGQKWGDESRWLSAVAGWLSAGRGAATVVLNGGKVTLSDVGHSVAAGRPVVAVAGTGRSADLLVAALDGGVEDRSEDAGMAEARAAAASGLLTVLDSTAPTEVQRAQLSRVLSP